MPALLLLHSALIASCSLLNKEGGSSSDHPHFAYEGSYFYHWAPGAPGPPGRNYIFRFVPEKGLDPSFRSVRLGEEVEEPDISRNGDTIRLMVQRSGQGPLPGERPSNEDGENEKKSPTSAVIEYRLNGEDHSYRFERIPEREKKTRYQ